jgi:hypothetical protein
MATENKILVETYPAAEDLSDYKHHFVVLNSSGAVRLPDFAGENPIGILQNEPESGAAAVVCEIGRSKLVANLAMAIGTYVMPEYVSATDAGKGDDAAGNETKAVAIVVEAASAEDDLVSVLLFATGPSGSYTAVELTLPDGHIIVGQLASTGSAVVPTGDVTITNAGVTAIGANKVLAAMISDAAITSAKISDAQILTAAISDAQITTAKISAAQITSTLLATNAVVTAKISDASITFAKFVFDSAMRSELKSAVA